jgi:glycosyltransferase involved in cell wall biosynthesis
MKTISVVIPALNEEIAIGPVIKDIPIEILNKMGYNVEILVIDNGSKDKTPYIAREHGAKVIIQPIRGYGNAYKAGFANATGDIIATGDADLTYPFDILPQAVEKLENEKLEFINTDRLTTLSQGVMESSHILGNKILNFNAKLLFGWPFKDSQSGMWIFKRQIWSHLDVRSSGMPFSQELKIEAHIRGFRCDEMIIDYQARAGDSKINTISDGMGNILQLFKKRIQVGSKVTKVDVEKIEREWVTMGSQTGNKKEWETVPV